MSESPLPTVENAAALSARQPRNQLLFFLPPLLLFFILMTNLGPTNIEYTAAGLQFMLPNTWQGYALAEGTVSILDEGWRIYAEDQQDRYNGAARAIWFGEPYLLRGFASVIVFEYTDTTGGINRGPSAFISRLSLGLLRDPDVKLISDEAENVNNLRVRRMDYRIVNHSQEGRINTRLQEIAVEGPRNFIVLFLFDENSYLEHQADIGAWIGSLNLP